MNKKLLIALMVLLTACATNDIYDLTPMRDGLDSLIGANIENAYNYLGRPTEVARGVNKNFYYWTMQYDYQTTNYIPQTARAYDQNYNQYNISYTQAVSLNRTAWCFVDITTNKDNVILDWQYNGNSEGCAVYAMSFKKIGNYKSPDDKLADMAKKEDNLFIKSSVFGIKSTMTKSDLISKGIILKKIPTANNRYSSNNAPINSKYFERYIYDFDKNDKICLVRAATAFSNDKTKTQIRIGELAYLLQEKYGQPTKEIDEISNKHDQDDLIWFEAIAKLNKNQSVKGYAKIWTTNLDNNLRSVTLYPYAIVIKDHTEAQVSVFVGVDYVFKGCSK